jgi:hypothetical protein
LNFQLALKIDGGFQTDTLNPVEGTLVHPFQRKASLTVLEVMDPKRMAVSARRTHALQQSGLRAIRGKVSSGQMKEPVFYGYSQHYNSICCWGGNDPKQHCGGHGCVTNTGIIPLSVVPEDREEDPVLLSDVFRAKKTRERPTNKDLKFDFKAYQTKSRIVDVHMWPQPNTKATSSKKTLAEMMTLGYAMDGLSKVGNVQIVTSTNPIQKKEIVKVPLDQ